MSATEREVTLPVGLVDDAGRWLRNAAIRKMRGHEEALLYDTNVSSGRFVTQLVSSCMTRLGDLTDMKPAMAARMYSADRNYLLFEIRRFTFGDVMSCSYRCPACGAGVSTMEDLSQISVRRYAGPEPPRSTSLVLEDGYRDRDGTLHRDIRMRLPRGDDEEFVSETAERDPLRARDAMILRCVESFGTLPRAALEAYGVRILRDLTLGDRNMIYRAIDDEAPGVDMRRRIECSSCGAVFNSVVEATNFFLPA